MGSGAACPAEERKKAGEQLGGRSELAGTLPGICAAKRKLLSRMLPSVSAHLSRNKSKSKNAWACCPELCLGMPVLLLCCCQALC
jgi:hypothetical protein